MPMKMAALGLCRARARPKTATTGMAVMSAATGESERRFTSKVSRSARLAGVTPEVADALTRDQTSVSASAAACAA